MTLPRLPHSAATKAKIAKALAGRPRSEATKAKIAAALRGRKHSPATIERIKAARAQPRETPQEYTRRRHRREMDARLEQWRQDRYAAVRLGNRDLLRDVLASDGWRNKRRVFDQTGKVSPGYGPPKRIRLEDQEWMRAYEVQCWLDKERAERARGF